MSIRIGIHVAVGLLLVMALIGITPPGKVRADGMLDRFCGAPGTVVVVDKTVSVGQLLEFELHAASRVRNALAGCLPAGSLQLGAFSGSDVRILSADTEAPLDRIREESFGKGWSDPVQVVASVRRSVGADVAVVIIMDGAFEPGPADGPPGNPDGYLDQLQNEAKDAPLFIWSIRGPLAGDAEKLFEQQFGALLSRLDEAGLGTFSRVRQPTELTWPPEPNHTPDMNGPSEPTPEVVVGDRSDAAGPLDAPGTSGPGNSEQESQTIPDLPLIDQLPLASIDELPPDPREFTGTEIVVVVVVMLVLAAVCVFLLRPSRRRRLPAAPPRYWVALEAQQDGQAIEHSFFVATDQPRRVVIGEEAFDIEVVEGLVQVRNGSEGVAVLVPERVREVGSIRAWLKTSETAPARQVAIPGQRPLTNK